MGSFNRTPPICPGVVTTATRVPQRRAGDTALDDAGTAALGIDTLDDVAELTALLTPAVHSPLD
jgi:hypothetical protein